MIKILQGDCRAVLPTLPAASAHCCVTSPPYWGLRDYGCAGQLGLEPSPAAYVAAMVEVFREVRRVLRDDGTLWLNLGDSYAGYHGNGKCADEDAPSNKAGYVENMRSSTVGTSGLKQKDLVGIPWRVAFALQADGWYLRQDIIWHKPNPMPESVTDRCTKAHEYIFLLSKSARYYFDATAIQEQASGVSHGGSTSRIEMAKKDPRFRTSSGLTADAGCDGTRNKRDVWTVPTAPYPHSHFATFPPDLIRPCILAGCPQGGTVLDPFFGSGTVGEVAEMEGRNSIGIELSAAYIKLAEKRTAHRGLFCQDKGAT